MKEINKKGFTLVELLGVIVIIILILSLVLPKIISRVRSEENNVAVINDDIISRAAALYVDDNKDDYPEVNGNRYCISLSDLDENYLGTELKDYRKNDITGKEIQVEYNNAYIFSVVAEGMCVESSIDSSRCDSDGLCNVCYVSKTYNSVDEVYTFEPKIIEEIRDKTQSEVESLVGSVYVESMDDCTLLAIMEAAKQYVKDHPSSFKKINGNTYCLPLSRLVSAGYLISPLIYQNQDIADTHSIEVTVRNSQYQYSLTPGNTCQEVLECGTYIDLPSNLTPVVYDESVKKWRIVDKDDPNWFDYVNQKWANAVILTETASSNKHVGDTIDIGYNYTGYDDDAYMMFVWIPRFAYTIKRTYSNNSVTFLGRNDYGVSYSNIGGIDIRCESASASKKTGSAYYTGNSPQNWYTHPAFTLGAETADTSDDTELNGIWFAKFNLTSTSSYTSTDVSTYRILPNKAPTLQLNIQNIYSVAQTINSNSMFRFNSSESHIHVEKNTDYVAMILLAWSDYGKYGNSDYSGENKKIYYNNSTNSGEYYTGRSYGLPTNGGYNYSIYGTYAYDVGTTQTSYSVNGGLTNVNHTDSLTTFAATSGGYKASTGTNDGRVTINFTIDQGKIGKLYFNYTIEKNGSSGGSIYYELEKDGNYIYTKGDEDNFGSNGDYILEPGNYVLKFTYDAPGKLSKCWDGSIFSGSDNGKCYAEISNFSLKQTSSYSTVVNTNVQKNGIGASSTGTVYGIYDLQFSGTFMYKNVAGKYTKNYTDSQKAQRYINYFNKHKYTEGYLSSGCDGRSCKGYGVLYDFPNLSDTYFYENEVQWLQRDVKNSIFGYNIDNGTYNAYYNQTYLVITKP